MMDTHPISACTLSLDPPISRLGLGGWAFGRTGWGAQDDRDSRAAILRAVELGVNWIDTAAVYGNGRAEELVGATVSSLPEGDRPLIFTKGGVRVDPSSGATFRDLRPASLRRECEASLQRLGVERIDLYQLHWPVQDVSEVERGWEALGELQREGKIRWAGVSNFDVSTLRKCASIRSVDALQLPLSLLSRDAGEDLLPWALEHSVRVLAYSPLESGLLSGSFSLQRLRGLPESDWRSRREQFKKPALDRTLDLLKRLEPIAAGLDTSLAEMAIAWVCSWAGVDGVIVGARTPSQVDVWASPTVVLDDRTLEAIETALRVTGAGTGSTRPNTAA